MLTFVEAGNKFTCIYGDIDSPFYNSLCSMLDAFAKLFLQSPHNDASYFHDRLLYLSRSASGIGWGYGDHVIDTVNNLIL